MADSATIDLLTLTAQIVSAHVTRNKVALEDLSPLINDVYAALARVDVPVAEAQAQQPAVPVKRSIQHDHLVCLEDGAKVTTLKRYLRRFDLTPEGYRAKWGLPRDYPMVAPAYAAHRSALAKQFGLGTAVRTQEQSLPEPQDSPIEVEEPAEPVPEPRYTAASVFANFPGDEAHTPSEAAGASEGTERPGRKRFAQQSMRIGHRRARSAE